MEVIPVSVSFVKLVFNSPGPGSKLTGSREKRSNTHLPNLAAILERGQTATE